MLSPPLPLPSHGRCLPPPSLPPFLLGSGRKEAPSQSEATQVGKKIIGGMAHGGGGGGGGAECTIHLEYFLPEGEKGRPQPTSLSLPAANQRRHRPQPAPPQQHGPFTCDREGVLNFECSLGFPLSLFLPLSLPFIFPPAADHYLRSRTEAADQRL